MPQKPRKMASFLRQNVPPAAQCFPHNSLRRNHSGRQSPLSQIGFVWQFYPSFAPLTPCQRTTVPNLHHFKPQVEFKISDYNKWPLSRPSGPTDYPHSINGPSSHPAPGNHSVCWSPPHPQYVTRFYAGLLPRPHRLLQIPRRLPARPPRIEIAPATFPPVRNAALANHEKEGVIVEYCTLCSVPSRSHRIEVLFWAL